MKKILIIFLSFLAFAPQSIEAVKEKNESREQREPRVLGIVIRCPRCRHIQTVKYDENKSSYTVDCKACSHYITIDTRFGLRNTSVYSLY